MRALCHCKHGPMVADSCSCLHAGPLSAAQAWQQKGQRHAPRGVSPSALLRCWPMRRAPPSAPAPKRATDRTGAAARAGARGAAARGSPPRPGRKPQAARVRLGHPPALTLTLASGAARSRACSCRPGWASQGQRSGRRALLTIALTRCSWGTMRPCRAACAAARLAICWCAPLFPCSMLGQHVAEHMSPAWQAGCALFYPAAEAGTGVLDCMHGIKAQPVQPCCWCQSTLA